MVCDRVITSVNVITFTDRIGLLFLEPNVERWAIIVTLTFQWKIANLYVQRSQRTLAAIIPHGTFYPLSRIPTPLRSAAALLSCFVINTSLVYPQHWILICRRHTTPNDESLNAQILSKISFTQFRHPEKILLPRSIYNCFSAGLTLSLPYSSVSLVVNHHPTEQLIESCTLTAIWNFEFAVLHSSPSGDHWTYHWPWRALNR